MKTHLTLLLIVFGCLCGATLYASDTPVVYTDPLYRAGIFPLSDSVTRLSPHYDENAAEYRARLLTWVDSAQNGDIEAQYRLGTELLSGRKVRRNEARAVFYFRLAAERGHPAALFNLGICFEEGRGIPLSRRFAAECYRQASAAGLTPASYNWALCLKTGLPADIDYELPPLVADIPQAERILASIVEKFPAAQRERALIHLGYPAFAPLRDSALVTLQQLGHQGDAGSLRILGDLALRPIDNTAPDSPRAFRYYSEAAAAGDHEALAKKALCLEKGIGTTASPKAALTAYEAAAEAGSAMAMLALAEAYLHGGLVDTDIDKGLALLVMVSRKGDPAALCMLGLCAYNGIGQPQDYAVAGRFFSAAAELGYTQAQYNFALLILEKKIEGEARDAVKWLKAAAEAGDPDAMYAYANCLLKGHGCVKDGEYAMMWLRKAARMGHPPSNAVIEALITAP